MNDPSTFSGKKHTAPLFNRHAKNVFYRENQFPILRDGCKINKAHILSCLDRGEGGGGDFKKTAFLSSSEKNELSLLK